MKIAMIGSRGLGTSYGGIERVLDAVTPELVSLGHSIDVFAGQSAASSFMPGVNVIKVPSINGKHAETITRSTLSVLRAVGNYDVVHLHAIGPGVLSALTGLVGQPTVVTIHGLDQRREKWGVFAKSCLGLAESTIVNCASEITVVSEELRRYFLERYDLRTSFIPNGLPSVSRKQRGVFLQSLGLSDRQYVFFAARLTPEKGCHDLIRAHARLDDGTVLVIAGKAMEAEYEEQLRRLAGPNVLFVGHRSGTELQELYSNTSLFVLPSYLEGMSMALLEALAYGVPLVVSDIPENVQVTKGDAIRFRPRDVEDLTAALKQGLSDSYQRLSRAAHWPTWPKVALSYSNVYRRMSKQPKIYSPEVYERPL